MGAVSSRDLSLDGQHRPVTDQDLCAVAKLRSWKGNVVETLLLVPFAPSCHPSDPLLAFLHSFILSDPFYPCFDVTCTQPACDRFPTVQAFHAYLQTMHETTTAAAATDRPEDRPTTTNGGGTATTLGLQKSGGKDLVRKVPRSWILLRLQDNQIDPNANTVKYGFVQSLVNVPGCKLAVAGYYHSLSTVTLPPSPGAPVSNVVDISFCLARTFCNEARSAALFHAVGYFERANTKQYAGGSNNGNNTPSSSQATHLPTSLNCRFRKGNLPALRLFAKLFQWHLTVGGQPIAELGPELCITPVTDSSSTDCLCLTLSDTVLNQVMRKLQFVARKSASGAITMPSFIQAAQQPTTQQPAGPPPTTTGKRGGNKQQQNVDQLAGAVSTPFDEMIQAEKSTWCAEEDNNAEASAAKKAAAAAQNNNNHSKSSGRGTPNDDYRDSYGMMLSHTSGGAGVGGGEGYLPQAFGMGCPSDDGFSAFASSGTIASGVHYAGGGGGGVLGGSKSGSPMGGSQILNTRAALHMRASGSHTRSGGGVVNGGGGGSHNSSHTSVNGGGGGGAALPLPSPENFLNELHPTMRGGVGSPNQPAPAHQQGSSRPPSATSTAGVVPPPRSPPRGEQPHQHYHRNGGGGGGGVVQGSETSTSSQHRYNEYSHPSQQRAQHHHEYEQQQQYQQQQQQQQQHYHQSQQQYGFEESGGESHPSYQQNHHQHHHGGGRSSTPPSGMFPRHSGGGSTDDVSNNYNCFPLHGMILPDATPVHASNPNGTWIPCWWSDSSQTSTQLYVQRCNYQPHLNDGRVLLELSSDSLHRRHPQHPLPLVDAHGKPINMASSSTTNDNNYYHHSSSSSSSNHHIPVVAVPIGTTVQGPHGMYNL